MLTINKYTSNRDISSNLIYSLSVLFSLTIFGLCRCSDNPVDSTEKQGISPSNWEIISNSDSAGWSSKKLEEAENYSRTIQTAAVMIIFDGKLLYQWGEVARKFKLHSCRKSLMSALYGIHVDNGNIDLSETMAELGIDDTPPFLSDLEKTATIRMLLQSRSGIYHPAAAMSSANPPERNSHEPGTYWYYNNWDFNTLGTIFEQETGTKIFEEFKRSIANPIGMEDFLIDDGYYTYNLVSIHPSYGFYMTARDLARFGLLFLQKGKWDDKQIISEEWIEESTTSYSDAGENGGYGYMWWIAVNGVHFPYNVLNGAYSARGQDGHILLIIPDYNLVIVHRVDTFIGNSVSYSEFGRLVRMILNSKIQ